MNHCKFQVTTISAHKAKLHFLLNGTKHKISEFRPKKIYLQLQKRNKS